MASQGTPEGGVAAAADGESVTRIGLLAGAGDFPKLIARAARGQGVEVIVFGLEGYAGQDLADLADGVEWLKLGQFQRLLDLLKAREVRHVILAGRVPHATIFQLRHLDMRAIKTLAKAANRKADTLLSTFAAELEAEGHRVLDSSLYLKSLMPEPGLLTPKRPLTEQERQDVSFGLPIAKAVAGQDIGQSIVVKEGVVVAVEGVEGTDECIRRAGQLAGAGCVLVKVSKPRQDFRFDIPVVGLHTIRVLQESGCTALAISARESLVFDGEEFVRAAEAAGIAVTAEA